MQQPQTACLLIASCASRFATSKICGTGSAATKRIAAEAADSDRIDVALARHELNEQQLAAQKPEQERQHDGNNQAGDDREIEAAALRLDADVAGQASEPELADPRPCDARYDEQGTEDDERALHAQFESRPSMSEFARFTN